MAIFNRATEEVKIGNISVCYVIPGLAIEEFESVPETPANGHNPRIIARSKKAVDVKRTQENVSFLKFFLI